MKTVLITGATGAIGSALVPVFLENRETSVRLLVRARSAAHLDERMRRLLEFCSLEPSAVASRLEALRGDVTDPTFGLDALTYKRLATEVTHVVHAAGNVRLNASLDDARRDAVESTRSVIALAQACMANGQFRKLEFVSTVGVAGRHRGVVPERRLERPRAFRNTYETAKAEAEDAVWDEARAGLPATIHRPSMVVGESTTGKIIHFQVFYYLVQLLSGKKTFGFVPDTPDMTVDIVPVDYVARAIHVASESDQMRGRALHLCAGPQRALRLPELAARVRAILRARGERLPRLRTVPLAWLRRVLPVFATVGPARVRRALASAPFLLSYLDEPQVFDNAQSDRLLSAAGLTMPSIDDYLPRVIDYYERRRTPPRQ